jgi:hypothetical protein
MPGEIRAITSFEPEAEMALSISEIAIYRELGHVPEATNSGGFGPLLADS